MFIYGGLKECTGGTKRRINGTQAVKYSQKKELLEISHFVTAHCCFIYVNVLFPKAYQQLVSN